MNKAINELQRAAEIAEHNLPYSEQAGDFAQADLQRSVSSDCREAIERLQEQAHAEPN